MGGGKAFEAWSFEPGLEVWSEVVESFCLIRAQSGELGSG